VSIPNNLKRKINELNEEQLNLFNDIMKKLQNNNQHEQINFFCSGVAGLYEIISNLIFIE
jgi:Fe-S oxidoreductase